MPSYSFDEAVQPTARAAFIALRKFRGPVNQTTVEISVNEHGDPRPYEHSDEVEVSRWISGWLDTKPRSELSVSTSEGMQTLCSGELHLLLTDRHLIFSVRKGTAAGCYPIDARAYGQVGSPNGKGTTVAFRWPLPHIAEVIYDGERVALSSPEPVADSEGIHRPQLLMTARTLSAANAKWSVKGIFAREQQRPFAEAVAAAAGITARRGIFRD